MVVISDDQIHAAIDWGGIPQIDGPEQYEAGVCNVCNERFVLRDMTEFILSWWPGWSPVIRGTCRSCHAKR